MPLLLALFAICFVSACGSDDGPSQPAQPQMLSGQVTKGPVAGAAVTVHAISGTGAPGAVIGGPWTTDAQGGWSGEIPAGSNGPHLIVATGGSYVDEASAASVALGSGQLMGYATGASTQVTPYTHVLVRAARERIEQHGEAPSAAWAAANASFQAAFGFDPALTTPALSGSIAARTYFALLGGFSALLDENPALEDLSSADRFELVLALADDLSDGVLDGLDVAGAAILVAVDGGTVAWPALDATGIGALVDAVNAWAAATEGLGDIELDPVDWDFDGPAVGNGSGSVTFSGPGAAALSQTTFTPIVFTTNETALAWATASSNFSAQVGVSAVPGNPSAASLMQVGAQTSDGNFAWQTSIFGTQQSAIPGVSIAGQVVTFTNVTLSAIVGSSQPLTVNGQLGP